MQIRRPLLLRPILYSSLGYANLAILHTGAGGAGGWGRAMGGVLWLWTYPPLFASNFLYFCVSLSFFFLVCVRCVPYYSGAYPTKRRFNENELFIWCGASDASRRHFSAVASKSTSESVIGAGFIIRSTARWPRTRKKRKNINKHCANLIVQRNLTIERWYILICNRNIDYHHHGNE